MAKFKFQGIDGRQYVYEDDDAKQVANVRKSVLAATEKIAAVMEKSEKRTRSTEPKVKTEVQVIRDWARENGVPVGARGRLNPAVIEAYAEAHAE